MYPNPNPNAAHHLAHVRVGLQVHRECVVAAVHRVVPVALHEVVGRPVTKGIHRGFTGDPQGIHRGFTGVTVRGQGWKGS